jgi:hypothetical protein
MPSVERLADQFAQQVLLIGEEERGVGIVCPLC